MHFGGLHSLKQTWKWKRSSPPVWYVEYGHPRVHATMIVPVDGARECFGSRFYTASTPNPNTIFPRAPSTSSEGGTGVGARRGPVVPYLRRYDWSPVGLHDPPNRLRFPWSRSSPDAPVSLSCPVVPVSCTRQTYPERRHSRMRPLREHTILFKISFLFLVFNHHSTIRTPEESLWEFCHVYSRNPGEWRELGGRILNYQQRSKNPVVYPIGTLVGSYKVT